MTSSGIVLNHVCSFFWSMGGFEGAIYLLLRWYEWSAITDGQSTHLKFALMIADSVYSGLQTCFETIRVIPCSQRE